MLVIVRMMHVWNLVKVIIVEEVLIGIALVDAHPIMHHVLLSVKI